MADVFPRTRLSCCNCCNVVVEFWTRRYELVSDEVARVHWHANISPDMARQLRWQTGRLVPQQDRSNRFTSEYVVCLKSTNFMYRLRSWARAGNKDIYNFMLTFRHDGVMQHARIVKYECTKIWYDLLLRNYKWNDHYTHDTCLWQVFVRV